MIADYKNGFNAGFSPPPPGGWPGSDAPRFAPISPSSTTFSRWKPCSSCFSSWRRHQQQSTFRPVVLVSTTVIVVLNILLNVTATLAIMTFPASNNLSLGRSNPVRIRAEELDVRLREAKMAL